MNNIVSVSVESVLLAFAARAKKEAEEKAEKELERVLNEQKRIAEEKAKIEAEKKKREEDERHRAKIEEEAIESLIMKGIRKSSAEVFVTAVAQGSVKHIYIRY